MSQARCETVSQSPPAKRPKLHHDPENTKQSEGAKQSVNTEQDEVASEERPGDPDRSETFLNCATSVNKLTAYLGFESTSALYTIAVSWPFLRATTAMHPIRHKLPKELTLGLLRSAQVIEGLAVIDNKWALLNSDGHGSSNVKKAEHLAIVLVDLRSDLARMAAASSLQNEQLHLKHSSEFETKYPTVTCPPVSYPVYPPILRPLAGESYMEPYNRCLEVLKNTRDLISANHFKSRYRNHNSRSEHRVIDGFKPSWMRSHTPRKSESPVVQPKSISKQDVLNPSHTIARPLTLEHGFSTISSVSTAPSQPCMPNGHDHFLAQSVPNNPPSISIVWDHALEPEHSKAGLKRALNQAKIRGTRLPSELQKLGKSPLLMVSESSLYDEIRKQFECDALNVQLDKLLMQYSTKAFGEEMVVVQNLDSELWADTKAALSDPANSSFVLRVGFFADEV